MMEQAVRDFPRQFAFSPQIENKSAFDLKDSFILCGMGGSHLAGEVLQALKPELDIVIHQDYGLPNFSLEEKRRRLVILSSYSGNTEEVIDSFGLALEEHLSAIVIASGGKLVELAEQHSIPYILLPKTGIQPRSALGFSFMALLKAMGDEALMNDALQLSQTLKPEAGKDRGRKLAEELVGRIPIIYASRKNLGLSYNWKIKFNETGKIPAFQNVFPELNHNEMTGFDLVDSTKVLSERFYFIILVDKDDHPKIQKRMRVLRKLYISRGLPANLIEMSGSSRIERVFNLLILADWAALFLAKHYGVEAEQVPMVEEFKKLID